MVKLSILRVLEQWASTRLSKETKNNIKDDIERRNRALTNEIASRATRGNVSAQIGRTLTQEEIEFKIRAVMSSKDFPEI